MRKFSKKTVAMLGIFAAIAAVAASGAAASHRASVQVCVLLPDTKSSVRWEDFDKPDFAKALKAAGVTYSITNALNDPAKQKSQVRSPCPARVAVSNFMSALWRTGVTVRRSSVDRGCQLAMSTKRL